MKTRTKHLLGAFCLIAVLTAAYFIHHAGQEVEAFYAAARQGDAAKQTTLGVYYYRGDPFPHLEKSMTPEQIAEAKRRAAEWKSTPEANKSSVPDLLADIEREAEEGNPAAQFNLGLAYLKGDGVMTDDTEAIKWLRKAAESHESHAENLLGILYDQGNGVPQILTSQKECV